MASVMALDMTVRWWATISASQVVTARPDHFGNGHFFGPGGERLEGPAGRRVGSMSREVREVMGWTTPVLPIRLCRWLAGTGRGEGWLVLSGVTEGSAGTAER